MEAHFWIASVGILLYVVAIYSAGVTQGLMWRAFDETGRLMYHDLVETVLKLMPMYWLRAAGGTRRLAGSRGSFRLSGTGYGSGSGCCSPSSPPSPSRSRRCSRSSPP